MIAPTDFPHDGLCRHGIDEAEEAIVTQLFRPLRAEVLVCPLVNRVYVLVASDDLAAAVATARRAAPLGGRTLVPMTAADLDRGMALAQKAFSNIDGISNDLAGTLVEQGLFSLRDLACISLSDLMALGDVTASQGRGIIDKARKRILREP